MIAKQATKSDITANNIIFSESVFEQMNRCAVVYRLANLSDNCSAMIPGRKSVSLGMHNCRMPSKKPDMEIIQHTTAFFESLPNYTNMDESEKETLLQFR